MSDLTCPFCKSPPLPFTVFNFVNQRMKACNHCGARGPAKDNEEAAAEAWNTRPVSVPVEALRQAMEHWQQLLDEYDEDAAFLEEAISDTQKLIDQAERREGS